MEYINVIIQSLSLFVADFLGIIPRLIAAYIIWLIGKWLIDTGLKGLDLLQVKKWKIDDSIREVLKKVFSPTAKIILILAILDTLGIGSNVVGAVANALSFTFAIGLGISFGRALEPEARQLVESVKKEIQTNVTKEQK